MNAVIITMLDDVDDLKKQLADIPNMDGLELLLRFQQRTLFLGEKNAKYKISALD